MASLWQTIYIAANGTISDESEHNGFEQIAWVWLNGHDCRYNYTISLQLFLNKTHGSLII